MAAAQAPALESAIPELHDVKLDDIDEGKMNEVARRVIAFLENAGTVSAFNSSI